MDHKVKEAIVLAGGLGTRLADTIGDVPKPLAPVHDQTFLDYLLKHLYAHGIESVVLSVGYKSEKVREVIGTTYLGMNITYSIETDPLGTGGGLKLALNQVQSENCFVLNGDSLFDFNLQRLAEFHLEGNNTCTIAAKEMVNFSRYGTIDINDQQAVYSFNEKKQTQKGLINAGVYCLNKKILDYFPQKDSFSLETDFFEAQAKTGLIKAKVFEGYFIDIGVPEDYYQFIEDKK